MGKGSRSLPELSKAKMKTSEAKPQIPRRVG
jgi:hypothetical protein